MIDTPESRPLTKDEVGSALQIEILNSLQEINSLLPDLGHGEAKRLLMANLSYPLETQDFGNESESMRKAYSASKRITDSMIALGTEVVLESLMQQKVTEEGAENEQN